MTNLFQVKNYKYSVSKFLSFLTALGILISCMHKETIDYFEQGNTFARDGLYNEAIFNYKKVLEKEPKNLFAKRNIGIILVKKGEYKEARKNLEPLQKQLSENFQTQYYLGEAYRAEGVFDKAIFAYKSSLNIRPNNLEATKALAWSYYKIKYYKAALSTIDSLAKADYHKPQVTIIRARILMKQKRYKAAERVATRLLRGTENHYKPYVRSILGDIHASANRDKIALRYYQEALSDKPYLPGALLGVGRLMAKTGKTNTAIKYLTRALRIRPNLTEAYLLLGKTLEKVDPEKSVAYYKAFIKRSRNDPEFSGSIPESRRRISNLRKNQNLGNGSGRAIGKRSPSKAPARKSQTQF